MFAPTDFHIRDQLERRYDGPIPPADPAAMGPPAGLRARLFHRMAAETRARSARRRALLTAALAAGDERLGRLGRDLGSFRAQGVAWLGR
jgi:hypothetical protein